MGDWCDGFWRVQIILEQQQHQIAGLQHSVENVSRVVVSYVRSSHLPGSTLFIVPKQLVEVIPWLSDFWKGE